MFLFSLIAIIQMQQNCCLSVISTFDKYLIRMSERKNEKILTSNDDLPAPFCLSDLIFKHITRSLYLSYHSLLFPLNIFQMSYFIFPFSYFFSFSSSRNITIPNILFYLSSCMIWFSTDLYLSLSVCLSFYSSLSCFHSVCHSSLFVDKLSVCFL